MALFMCLRLAVNECRYVCTSIHFSQKEMFWTLTCKTLFPWCYVVIMSKDLRQFVGSCILKLWKICDTCFSVVTYRDSEDVLSQLLSLICMVSDLLLHILFNVI